MLVYGKHQLLLIEKLLAVHDTVHTSQCPPQAPSDYSFTFNLFNFDVGRESIDVVTNFAQTPPTLSTLIPAVWGEPCYKLRNRRLGVATHIVEIKVTLQSI